MKKMRNFLTLAAAAALTGILLTGCSTEADETESFSRKIVYRYRQNDDRFDNIKSFIFIEGSI